ncbi:MAG TPA: phosphate transport system regulatory protein PhoU, partial [Candidatus Nocardiopsis merdipullorum]|nr:phosphate transport system regulatory protein PhoU [Candidatus Nocardiopsis merdipullorum]
MGHQAELLVTKAGEVISERDAETALELDEDDDRMDRLRRKLLQRILSPNWEYGVEATMDVTLVGRFYERYGDHAVHVADNLIYMVTGEKREDYEPE